MKNIIIFDLDGVITSEEAYWDTAGLVVHELLYSPHYWNIGHTSSSYHPVAGAEESHLLANAVLPHDTIVALKARSINSNWDTCYVGMSFCLIHLLAHVPHLAALLPLCPENAEWTQAFREQLARVDATDIMRPSLYSDFASPIFEGQLGMAFIERLNDYASVVLGQRIEGVFGRYRPSWLFCQDLFQEWYLGDALYTQSYGHAPAQTGKEGCIHFERPLLPKEQIASTLAEIRAEGYVLGVATGRPGIEATLPLQNYGWWHYFDEPRITTHAEVERTENMLRTQGQTQSLVKPHPYQFMLAANPDYRLDVGNQPRKGSFIVVGDTPSDVNGGREAGAITVAVLTGARTAEARRVLEASQPDFIIQDVTRLPSLLKEMDDLAMIQSLQFTKRAKAELLLQHWFARHMHIEAERVTLTPKAVSLNSFNGFYEAEGAAYFFKTHVEDQGILQEYYHAELLFNAGYHIVRPLRTIHEQGRQMVIYPVIHWPVMFDLMRAVEMGSTHEVTQEQLASAERQECERLLHIYRATLTESTAQEHAHAPIHQLFWHRLAGERLKHFYSNKVVPLPQNAHEQYPFAQLVRYRWQINGTRYPMTLGELIARGQELLQPEQAGVTVIGHGDAHFGNVFLEEQERYLYFDPAFAGRHSPLLDIVKPLFHNIFATWMYFPHEIAQTLHLSVRVQDDTIIVEHDYRLTSVRQAMLATKLAYLVTPLIDALRSRDVLPSNWQETVQSALLCCPLLTINLFDEARLPASIGWLGLTLAVIMGHSDLPSLARGLE